MARIMKSDSFGRLILSEEEVLDFIYEHPDTADRRLGNLWTLDGLAPRINDWNPANKKEFDETLQSHWLKNVKLDAYDHLRRRLLLNVESTTEFIRIKHELEEFEKRKLQQLLVQLDMIVKLMRENNIVWGVGRGSSVSSHVLYLLGVHKINSMKYNLDYHEFFK